MTRPAPDAGHRALLLPLGHYMGEFHEQVDGPLKYRKVRIGVDVEQLAGEEQFGVWALAHGMPDRVNQGPWTRESVTAVAGEMGMSKIDQVVDELVSQGLLAEVAPGTDAAAEFARGHRIQPLMMGLGNSPEDPLHFSLGFVGSPPVLKINSFQYELWQWGRVAHSFWHTAEMFVQVERKVADDRAVEPRHIIDRILGELHPLLAHNAAYLDRVLEPATTG